MTSCNESEPCGHDHSDKTAYLFTDEHIQWLNETTKDRVMNDLSFHDNYIRQIMEEHGVELNKSEAVEDGGSCNRCGCL